MIFRRRNFVRTFILSAILFFAFYFFNSNLGSSTSITDIQSYLKTSDSESVSSPSSKYKYDTNNLKSVTVQSFLNGDSNVQKFFATYFQLLQDNKCSYPLQQRMTLDDSGKPRIDPVYFIAQESDDVSEEKLMSLFEFNDEFVNDLTAKHKNVVSNMPSYTPTFYKGKGYAIVGGGKYSWFSFLAVKSLRKLGAKLPAEIILPTASDYEPLLCEELLPKLNAKCVQMENVFGKEILEKMNLTGYQLKGLALLASSFKDVFLLDSDSYALTNPEPIFTSKLYEEYKMITWPDFWRRTDSPLYYKIAGIDVKNNMVRHLNDVWTDLDLIDPNRETKNVKTDIAFHDRENTLQDWSTESGEMLIDKTVHFKSLLLALYYNADGPFCYHPLLSQGGAGEGDKETFVAGANYFKLPYYQVYKRPDKTYGFWNHLNTWEHGAIVQYDPLTDYENVKKIQQRIKTESKDPNFKYDYNKYFIEGNPVSSSKPMFYHCHDPKFDPFFLFEEKKMYVRKDGEVIDQKRRILGEDWPRGSIDLELSLWSMADEYICQKKLDFAIFRGKDHTKFCENFVPEQLRFLRESGKYIEDHYDPNYIHEHFEGTNDLESGRGKNL